MSRILEDSPAPGSLLVSATLPPAARSAYDGRRMLRAAIEGRLPPVLLETLLLLTTELISNAATYANTPLELRVSCSRKGELRVEVADSSSTLPQPAQHLVDSETGRGLRLVDALADAWGARPARGGKVMWFALQT